MKYRASILDSHNMFSQLLSNYLEAVGSDVRIVEICRDAAALLSSVEHNNSQIAILELSVGGGNCTELISDLKQQKPALKLIILSAYRDSKLVRKAMLQGADAYLYKGNSLEEFEQCLEEVISGDTYLGAGVRTSPNAVASRGVVQVQSGLQDAFLLRQNLTKREKEVLQNIAQGKNSREIGKELYISYQTVGVHRKNIMKKLGVRSTLGLIKLALEKELV